MERDDVIALREVHNTTGNIKIFGDNVLLFYDAMGITNNHTIWDDTNDTMHNIRTNQQQYNQDRHQVEITSFPYSMIEYFVSTTDLKTLEGILQQLKARGASIDDARIATIMAELEPLSKNTTASPRTY